MFTVTAERETRWRQARSLIGLAFLTWGMTQVDPRPALHGRGLAVVVGITVAGAAWVAMTLRIGGRQAQSAAVATCGGVGVALTVLSPHGFAEFYPAAACFTAALALPLTLAVGISVAVATAEAVTLLATDATTGRVLTSVGTLAVALLLGIVSRQRRERLEQNELLLAESQLAREEQARSAALAERARLAREIHDVLAHSLAALSVQLETADALLERDRTTQAREVIVRAGRLTREGLAETRRAVSALRGDPLPLPDLVAALAEGYRLDISAEATFTVTGEPRPLPADVGLALYRSAQEALTNVRKHAPGAAVDLALTYAPGEVGLTVTDSGGTDRARAAASPGLPGGYGLTGLRERAELAGGSVTAGPVGTGDPGGGPAGPAEDDEAARGAAGTGWRVDVRMPG